MIVCKFGGTSLADADKIKKVAEIIKSNDKRKMIVVSAPGKRYSEDVKITDMLYELCSCTDNKDRFLATFTMIKDRFLDMAKELNLKEAKLLEALEEIKEKTKDGANHDYVVSRGEYLNALLISEYLNYEFVDAADFVRLNGDGSINSRTYLLGEKLFSTKEKCVVPGFFGLGPDKNVKTFSRGGSDISGSLLANIVNAECYENWTDVSGILIADPRLVKAPTPVNEITYRELREMACIGANVFHQEAIFPAKEKGIPIQIKNTNSPEDPGTTISTNRDSHKTPIVGVSGKRNYIPVLVEKKGINSSMIKDMESKLKKAGYSTEFTLKSFDSATFYVSANKKFDKSEVNNLLASKVENIFFEQKTAMLGIVGQGLNWNIFKKLISDLDPINVEAINFGASSASAFVAVNEESYQPTLNGLVEGIKKL